MRRSKISQLPQAVLDELNTRLIGSGFSDYSGLAEWLSGQGFDISRSSLHRHGSELEDEFNAAISDARQTLALARAAQEGGDESGALMKTATEIMQDNLLRASLKLKSAEYDPTELAKTLSLISRAFVDVGRFEIQRQKWQTEVRAKLDALERESQKPGATLDAATLKAVKEALYG
ncbi:MAG: DUF3486 family protein [Azoarcus sp.]|jgi:hypothetical protein|nr:DUF3486 family protein [Azoarcus sp.]